MADSELPANIRLGAIDRLSKVLDKVKAKFPGMTKAVENAQKKFVLLHASTANLRKNLEKIGDGLVKFGKSMSLAITAPVGAAAIYAIKKFSDFEDALTAVRGSTNLSGEELKIFGERIIKLSTKLPVSSEELLHLAGAAGEAGVRGVDNLTLFSETLAKLAKTAGISGEEAAEPIAKILNLTGEGPGKVENFASAITALADTYGASAKNIIDSTFDITREISKFGLSSAQIAGLATAMEPFGFNAKQSATAVGEAFRGIDDAITKGGIKLEGLDAITGMTGAELKKQFKDNPEKIFESFLGGLNRLQQKGGDTGKALQFFGATGDKTGIILTGLAKDTNKLNAILKTSGDEYAKNTALSAEYQDATGTFSDKMKLLHNTTDALAQQLGAKLVPFISKFIDILTAGMAYLEAHPALSTFLATLAGFAAVAGPVIIGIGTLVGAFQKLIVLYEALTVAYGFLAAANWAAYIPMALMILKFVLIGAAIAALIYIIWKFRDAIWGGIVMAFDWIMEKIGAVYDKFTGLLGVMKQFLGFSGKSVDIAANATQTTEQKLLPQGAAIGGADAQSKMNPAFSTQTNNARVDINVRAPQSTTIQSESSGGMMSINRGLVGAF